MKKRCLFVLLLVALLLFSGCATESYPPYSPDKIAGNGGFDFSFDSSVAGVAVDGEPY